MSNRKNSANQIFSPEIFTEFKDRLRELEIVDIPGIIKLIKKHENLKNPRIFSYVEPERPVNPITVTKLFKKSGLNDDVVKEIAENYQRLLIKNVILQEEALIKEKALEARIKTLLNEHAPRKLVFRPSSSSSSSSPDISVAQSGRPARRRTRSIQPKRSRSARLQYVPYHD
jgi:hypothetical protein